MKDYEYRSHPPRKSDKSRKLFFANEDENDDDDENHNMSMSSLDGSAVLTPQWIEYQRQKSAEAEEKIRAQSSLPSLSSSSAAAPPPQEAAKSTRARKRSDNAKPSPVRIGAVAISGGSATPLTSTTITGKQKQVTSSTTSSMSSTPKQPPQPTFKEKSISTYWANEFQRESLLMDDGGKNSGKSRENKGIKVEQPQKQSPTMVPPIPEPPSGEFFVPSPKDPPNEPLGHFRVPRTTVGGNKGCSRANSSEVVAFHHSERNDEQVPFHPTVSHQPGALNVEGPAMEDDDDDDDNEMGARDFMDDVEVYNFGYHDHENRTTDTLGVTERTVLEESSFTAPFVTTQLASKQESPLVREMGLVEADIVDNAEPVFYAKDVRHDNFRRKVGVFVLAGLLICILVLGLVFGLRKDYPSGCKFDEPACCVDFSKQPVPSVVPLLCFCNQSLQPYIDSLTEENITAANTLGRRAVEYGIIQGSNGTYVNGDNMTSCDPLNQIYLTSARIDGWGVDIETLANLPPTMMENYYGLGDFFIQMCGIGWTNNHGWYAEAYMCDWFGLDCTFIDTISGIHLPANKLRGTIPTFLGKLSTIRSLDLAHNVFVTGTIPTELARMTALVDLNLGDLSLSGSIPPSLGQLERLDSLIAHNSGLSGTLPPELFHMKTVRNMQLHHNDIEGTIPASIGNATSLVVLRLNRNRLSGTLPTEIQSLTNLNILDLARNNLSGPFPTFLGDLPLLELVNIVDTGFTGQIPASFCETQLNREIIVRCSGISTNNGTRLPCMRCLEDFPEILRLEVFGD